jgi:hypothetical protein
MGLPITQDTVPYFDIVTDTISWEAAFSYVTFDSAGTSGGDGWNFSHGTNPTWSGAKEYQIEPEIVNCIPYAESEAPYVFSGTFCEELTCLFRVNVRNCGGTSIRAYFRIVEGPGQFDTMYIAFDEVRGQWSYRPTSAYADSTFMLGVVADIDYCGDSGYITPGWPTCWVEVHVGSNNHGPTFVDSQVRDFVATTGQPLDIQLLTEDADPCSDHRFSYYVDEGDPEPPGTIDELTGVFSYTGTEADTGIYLAYMVVTEGEFADTTAFTIYHYDSYTCGDMDHSGSIDISDLTWLVDYLFQYGPPPITVDAGDVNCSDTVDISDLTYFVDWLFGDGPPPCDGGC